ncbi:MAG: hypothetical protein AB7G93_19640 [Bdellovibrionales bacterium]
MAFSIRDKSIPLPCLRSERGQGIIEYVLILVVVVGIILGGLYQLNSAFKVWAQSYFGDYIACLLETGELPTISASPGDSGICNELFKPFSLADGRPLRTGASAGTNSSGGGSSGSGARENNKSGAGGAAGSQASAGGGRGSGAFGGRLGRGNSRPLGGQRFRISEKKSGTYTGDTSVSNYGGNYGALNRRLNTGVKRRLDDRFAFDSEREAKQKRQVASKTKSNTEGNGRKSRIRIIRKDIKKNAIAEDTPMTFGSFLRFLIIAAILIAIIMFLGGQALQIGKSME